MNTRTGDFNATSLSHVINTDTVNHLIVRSYLDRARKIPSLSFVNDVSIRWRLRLINSAATHGRHGGLHGVNDGEMYERWRRGEDGVQCRGDHACAIECEDLEGLPCLGQDKPLSQAMAGYVGSFRKNEFLERRERRHHQAAQSASPLPG